MGKDATTKSGNMVMLSYGAYWTGVAGRHAHLSPAAEGAGGAQPHRWAQLKLFSAPAAIALNLP
jgi:hypothetical protein